MSLLAAQAIEVRRGAVSVLHAVDAAVGAGELVGLIGPNGAGKTTLLRALAGLLPLAAGSVVLGGRPVSGWPLRELAQRIAYVEQSGGAAWPVRVSDLVGIGRLPHQGNWRRRQPDDEAAIAEALRATGCEGFADRAVDTLSSGERSRVMLARALAGNPKILLADEPVAALDPAQQIAVMSLLREMSAGGLGVLAVLHDLPLASRFCDRLIVLNDGRVLAEGSPSAVLSDALLGRAFGIEVARGEKGGLSYVLPWQRLP